jgi:Bacterial Ig-like domain
LAGRNRIGCGRLGLAGAVMLACAVLAAGLPAGALAAPPKVTIAVPSNGSVGNDQTPVFYGQAEVEPGLVTLRLYSGTTPTGAVLQEASTTLLLEGGWSLHLPEALDDGVYTAQASQTNVAEGTGSSLPVTFRVDTSAPTVTLDPPEVPPGDMAPAFTGTASDKTPVTVEIHEGASAKGTLVSVATAAGTGAGWRSSEASPALAVGQYTAVAVQESSLPGNPEGRSAEVTFAVQDAPPLVASLSPAVVAATVATKPAAVPHGPALMAPFPVVRLAGAQNRRGVYLRLLRIQQAPAGAEIRVRCRGRGCPRRTVRLTTVRGRRGVDPVTLRRFQRHLGVGAVLQVFISKPGTIGKYTRFTVRRGRLPERVDLCLDPAGVTPVPCPLS